MSIMKKASDLGDKNIPKQLLVQVTPTPLQVLYFREESTSPAGVTIEIWKLEDGNYAIFAGTNGEGAWSVENIKVFDQRPTLDSALSTVRQNFACANMPESKNTQMASKSRLKKVIAASTPEELELANKLQAFRDQLEQLAHTGKELADDLRATFTPSAGGRFQSYIVDRISAMASDREQFTFADVINELQNMED